MMDNKFLVNKYKSEIKNLEENWVYLTSLSDHNPKVKLRTQIKFNAGVEDIINFSGIFVESYKRALSTMNDQIKYFPDIEKGEDVEEYWKEFGLKSTLITNEYSILFKLFVFLLRKLQDSMYALLLNLDGNEVGPKTSISNLLNKKNNLAIKLNDFSPEYLEWFKDLRNIRDDIKYGITSGIQYSESGGLEICFHTISDVPKSIDIKRKVPFKYIIESLEMSNSILIFLRSKTQNS